MDLLLVVAIAAIVLALAFTFTNGFQDASAVAATMVASRATTPRKGIALVAVTDFLGALLGGSAVAFTISGLVTISEGPTVVYVMLVAVTGATIWNITAWRFGMPSSSTHALIGGLVGAALAAEGISSVAWGLDELTAPQPELTGLVKILLFLFISIVIGFAGGYLMVKASGLLLRNAKATLNRSISRAEWIAAGLLSFGNGANDAQKQMGVIILVLLSAGAASDIGIPWEVRLATALALGLGTLGGGWRIMRTLGQKIFSIRPIDSLDTQLASGGSIILSTLAGAPVSSTHVIASSILGAGAGVNPRMVRWSVGKEIVYSWVLTIPATIAVSAGLYWLLFGWL